MQNFLKNSLKFRQPNLIAQAWEIFAQSTSVSIINIIQFDVLKLNINIFNFTPCLLKVFVSSNEGHPVIAAW